jgi:hypothetical protein
MVVRHMFVFFFSRLFTQLNLLFVKLHIKMRKMGFDYVDGVCKYCLNKN